MSAPSHEKQIAEAEEMFGDRLARVAFAKGLFFGKSLSRRLPEYPDLAHDAEHAARIENLRAFCQTEIDPARIDREAEIPERVVRGLGSHGVLGACLPKSAGGMGMSQTAYCQLMEVLGGHCGGTALFVNAHHSIGPRAIVLFGTEAQQKKYLPKLATGEWLSAFALTEPEAGSDAGNVQTRATPTEDGTGYLLNGDKRWITNGGIAQVLTVMARTPVGTKGDSKVTAFIATPDMPGFQVIEKRMDKCGVRGSATARLAFQDMFVPNENILGPPGKGLKIALTVLDFGRTTFGASCTGAAKTCVKAAYAHARTRVQFGQPIVNFEMVQEKLAYMRAGAYAMEAATYQTAAIIDAGEEDFLIETAMLKVFSTEVLWRIVNDTIQIFGGKAYFTDEPYERMMRDARINMIGEGANDVLRSFVGLAGMRDVGLELKGVLDALARPFSNLAMLGSFAGRKIEATFAAPEVLVRSDTLRDDADRLGALIGRFGAQVEKLLRRAQEDVLDMQLQQGRIADAATELFVSSCVLSRIDARLRRAHGHNAGLAAELELARYFLASSGRRIRRALDELWDNDDETLKRVAAAGPGTL